MIFTVKSARKVTITDPKLARNMLPILLMTGGFLAAWTVAGRPHPVWLKTQSGLKYLRCSTLWWDYAAFGGIYESS